MKTYLPIDVNTATDQRLVYIFDHFEKVCVSFSGGKDSTVLLHKTIQEAEKRGRKVDVLFIDWEAQYQATINHVTEMMNHPSVNPFWVCLPMSTSNESSFHDPMWTAWHPDDQDRWVRQLPPRCITDYDFFPFYRFGMTFEEFVPAWNEWYAQDQPSAFLVGIRADESLNRYRAVKKQTTKKRKYYQDKTWSTQVSDQGFAFYPLYDWRVEDIWAFIGNHKLPYNTIYDRMYLLGMGLHDMRICEPYSREARKHLDKYQALEPHTWDKVVQRTGGVNFGAMYGKTDMLGYRNISKPEGFTWKEYAHYLLGTLPPPLRSHYERRITVFINWFKKNRGWTDLKEESDLNLEMKNLGGSWRMVCRTLLKNDYFCTHLSFGVNLREFEKFEQLKERYKDL